MAAGDMIKNRFQEFRMDGNGVVRLTEITITIYFITV